MKYNKNWGSHLTVCECKTEEVVHEMINVPKEFWTVPIVMDI